MKRFWEKKALIWSIYGLAALIASVQKLVQTRQMTPEDRLRSLTNYENYVIFKNSFLHLVQGANPYADFPAEQWDLFKYSPAFALAMAPFAALPDFLGLPLWNLLNALLPLAALLCLPGFTERQRVFCAWFILPEMVVSLQNSQSNGLTVGLLLWAYVAFERGQSAKAAGVITGAAFIKVFGIFAAVLGVLYSRKPAFLGWLTAWTVILTLAPLLLLSPGALAQVYGWWWELLRSDHENSVGLSVQGWLQTWFGWEPPKMAVILTGLGIFIASVLAIHRQPSAVQRIMAWASLLLWVVIFNHKAESPTFVIALCGVAMWWCVSRQGRGEQILLAAIFILASVSSSDIFPRVWREQIVEPYVLKAVPCIILWGIITFRLLRRKDSKPP